jgi:hypothetical protein
MKETREVELNLQSDYYDIELNMSFSANYWGAAA